MMTYRFDWTQATPGTPNVPPSLYTLNRNLEASDPDMSTYWLPLIERLSMLVVPPALVAQIQRVLTPFKTIGLGPKVIYPVPYYDSIAPWDWGNSDAHTMWNVCKQHLDYIDNALKDTSNLIRSFLPFPLIAADPWNPGRWPLLDPFRGAALENAPLRETDMFGDGSSSAWPADSEGPRWVKDDNGWGNLAYFSPLDRVNWGELQFTGAFAVDTTPSSGNDHWLTTPHWYGGYYLFADNYDPDESSTYLYSDVGDSLGDVGARYYKLFPSHRWMFAQAGDLGGGFLLPHTVVTEVPYEAVLRTLRIATEADWNYNTMREVTFVGMGSSLKELRSIFADMVGAALIERVSR